MAVAVSAVGAPLVRLAEGDSASGLAHLVLQLLEQSLAELETARRRAARLRGRVAVTADDYEVSVTLDFRGDEIIIHEGEQQAVDAAIRAPQRLLLDLLRGDGRPFVEHLRGRLRIRSSWRRPLLPLKLHRLLRIPTSSAETYRRRRVVFAGTLGAATLLVAALLFFYFS